MRATAPRHGVRVFLPVVCVGWLLHVPAARGTVSPALGAAKSRRAGPEARAAGATPTRDEPSRPPAGVGMPRTEPIIELVTMGQGPELFHRFGHAALCVVYRRGRNRGWGRGRDRIRGRDRGRDRDRDRGRDRIRVRDSSPGHPRTRCYNYGTTDFQSPPHELGWRFLRGTARFWVSTAGRRQMLAAYQRQDRSIWVQRIPLSQPQVDDLVARLAHDQKPENRYYRYHHFDDNCTTRLRDHLDAVTGGALRRGSQRGYGATLRELGRRHLADRTLLIVLANLTLGRRLDREATVWEAMFLPSVLRHEVDLRLGAPAVRIYQRRGPALPTEGRRGHAWLALLAFVLALPVVLTRWRGRFERLAIGLVAGVLCLLGTALWSVAIVTEVPEMRINEALLVFWPTDLLLMILGPRWRRRYVWLRVAWLGVAALLWAAGVLIQPIGAALLIPLLPLAMMLLHRPALPAQGDPAPSVRERAS